MGPEQNEREPSESKGLVPNFEEALQPITNAELLRAPDLALLELEKRLYRYARVGPELLDMPDEGLVLAASVPARLSQALSSAEHTEGHLQIVGVGEWKPTSIEPTWDTDPRLGGEVGAS